MMVKRNLKLLVVGMVCLGGGRINIFILLMLIFQSCNDRMDTKIFINNLSNNNILVGEVLGNDTTQVFEDIRLYCAGERNGEIFPRTIEPSEKAFMLSKMDEIHKDTIYIYSVNVDSLIVNCKQGSKSMVNAKHWIVLHSYSNEDLKKRDWNITIK